MPMHKIEFRVPEFNQRAWATKFSVVCASMEKARSGLSQGTGRPQNEDDIQSKVTVFLGRDEEARKLKKKKLNESTMSWTKA